MDTEKKTGAYSAAEIIIGLGYVSPELTGAAESWLCAKFGAFFRIDGIGAYNGKPEISARYVIGTSEPSNILWQIIVDFAMNYCKAGAQESVYFVDKKGKPWLIFANGKTAQV